MSRDQQRLNDPGRLLCPAQSTELRGPRLVKRWSIVSAERDRVSAELLPPDGDPGTSEFGTGEFGTGEFGTSELRADGLAIGVCEPARRAVRTGMRQPRHGADHGSKQAAGEPAAVSARTSFDGFRAPLRTG
jgi:hypothetical protein